MAAVEAELEDRAVGEEIELLTSAFPAIAPDLEAWCRATGNTLVELRPDGDTWRLTLRKGASRQNDARVAVVATRDALDELLSPLGFALAAALGGAEVAVYLQGPAVHVLSPGFKARLRGPARPFSRFARAGLEQVGHAPPAEKLRQLQDLGGRIYACGPSLAHFGVDPDRLGLDGVTVCEYFTFMEVMQRADVQLYA